MNLKKFKHLLLSNVKKTNQPNKIVSFCWFETKNYFYSIFCLETNSFICPPNTDKDLASDFPDVLGEGYTNEIKPQQWETNLAFKNKVLKGEPVHFDNVPTNILERIVGQIKGYFKH